jgi:hypothetical protein
MIPRYPELETLLSAGRDITERMESCRVFYDEIDRLGAENARLAGDLETATRKAGQQANVIANLDREVRALARRLVPDPEAMRLADHLLDAARKRGKVDTRRALQDGGLR